MREAVNVSYSCNKHFNANEEILKNTMNKFLELKRHVLKHQLTCNIEAKLASSPKSALPKISFMKP